MREISFYAQILIMICLLIKEGFDSSDWNQENLIIIFL